MKRNLQVTIILPALGLLTGLSSYGQQQKREQAHQKPNIIFIIADDLGYHDIGALSSGNRITPNLDKMMSEGVYLTDFVVTCPACSPSVSGYKSTLLMQLGNIAQRTGRALDIDHETGRIINDKEAMKHWSRSYEKGWEMK